MHIALLIPIMIFFIRTHPPSTLSQWILLILLILILLLQYLRAPIYDFFIVKMTSKWYREVLLRLPNPPLDENENENENKNKKDKNKNIKFYSSLLDVGIGTGSALAVNANLIKAKGIKVVGVDYDKDYVNRCKGIFEDYELNDYCEVYNASIYEFDPSKLNNNKNKNNKNNNKKGYYDAIYFSGSLMIMPDPIKALNHVKTLLKDSKNGLIYSTQTIQIKPSPILEFFKPLLKFITTIDFGNVTYENEFKKVIEQANLKIIEIKDMPSKFDTNSREAKLIILKSI